MGHVDLNEVKPGRHGTLRGSDVVVHDLGQVLRFKILNLLPPATPGEFQNCMIWRPIFTSELTSRMAFTTSAKCGTKRSSLIRRLKELFEGMMTAASTTRAPAPLWLPFGIAS